MLLLAVACLLPASPQQALAKLAAEGLKAEMELLDITKKESRESFVAAIKSKYGHVDSLVNNAGERALPIWLQKAD